MTYVASRSRGQTYVAGFAPNAAGRPADDFYPTPAEITQGLLSVEKFDGPIWEPACGDGSMGSVINAAGYEVVATDLVDRGYGMAGVDFLFEQQTRAPNIVTNPPYKLAEEFIVHAVKLASRKVAIFGRLGLLEGQARRAIWDTTPFARVWVFSRRIAFTKAGEQPYGSKGGKGGMIASAWYVWDCDHVGCPQLGWI